MSRPLGKNQQNLIDSLKEHDFWYNGCGWVWDTHSNTQRILDSLVKRGLVTLGEETIGPRSLRKQVYRLADTEKT